MKKIFYFISAIIALTAFTACMDDDDDDKTMSKYKDWYNENATWLDKQAALKNANGSAYYSKIVPSWDPSQYVLIHYFNDTTETKNNLKPLYTSYCTVNYTLNLCTDTIIDSATSYTAALNGGLIDGWAIALMNMHVGDTAQIVVPYQSAYGTSGTTGINPYSNLRFNIRLVDIANYETRPE
jgi:FKBP-type peptidyl-prolyl cis-trans isomerase FklB